MKKQYLSESLERIDEKYLDEAADFNGKRKKINKIPIIAIAAALAIVVTTLGGLLIMSRGNRPTDRKNTETSNTIPDSPVVKDPVSAVLEKYPSVDNLWANGGLKVNSIIYDTAVKSEFRATNNNSAEINSGSTGKTFVLADGKTVNITSVVADRYAIYTNQDNEVIVYDLEEKAEVNLLERILKDLYIPYENYVQIILDYAEENYPEALLTENNRKYFVDYCTYLYNYTFMGNADLPDPSGIELNDKLTRSIKEIIHGNDWSYYHTFGQFVDECVIHRTSSDDTVPDYDYFLAVAFDNAQKKYPLLIDTENNITAFGVWCEYYYYRYWFGKDVFDTTSYVIDVDNEELLEMLYSRMSVSPLSFRNLVTYCQQMALKVEDLSTDAASHSAIIWALDADSGMCLAQIARGKERWGSPHYVLAIYDIKTDTLTECDVDMSETALFQGCRVTFSPDGKTATIVSSAPDESNAVANGGQGVFNAVSPDNNTYYEFYEYRGENVYLINTDGSGGYLISNNYVISSQYQGEFFNYRELEWANRMSNYVRRACSEAYYSPSGKVVYYKVIPYDAYPRNIYMKGNTWYNRLNRYDSEDDKWAFYTVGGSEFSEKNYRTFKGYFIKFVFDDTAVMMLQDGVYHVYSLQTDEEITGNMADPDSGAMAHDLLTVYLRDGVLYRKMLFSDAEEQAIANTDYFISTEDGAFVFIYTSGNDYIECVNVVTLEKEKITLDPLLVEQLKKSADGKVNMQYNDSTSTLTMSYYLQKDTRRRNYTEINFVELLREIPYAAVNPSGDGIREHYIYMMIMIEQWISDRSTYALIYKEDSVIYGQTDDFPGYPDE